MLGIGGKGGGGVGQLLAAAAAALLLRLFSGPGPVLLPDEEEDRVPAVELKVAPVTIKWSNINCSLSDKSSKLVRFLLKNVSGEAKPGRLLAIMGPSGSGKTTLLNVLASQLVASPRLHLSGLLEVNGRPYSAKNYKLAYIRQEDLFFSQLTVRETLSLAAELQLQDISSVEARDQYVNDLLFKTGLVSCADSRVGDAKVRGISGGEKKRLSLACELIASPSVIFADEPTTGLDAFQAEKVMETLRQLAQDGHTVICSIHQPRGSVYAKFDDIVLLTEGSLVYAGPARDEALAYFSKFGFICPEHVNPAEFLADLISVDYSSAENVDASQKRIDGLIESFAEQMPSTLYSTSLSGLDLKDTTTLRKKVVAKSKGGWWRQFCLLLRRAWMQASRDGPTNKVRSRMSIASAIIFGSVFWRMGKSQTSIQDRMGLLQVAAINTAMAALTKTVGVFPKERAIVDRERAKGSYSLGPYLLSKLLAEIPVGAAFPLLFGTVLYPMTRLHPTMSRFGKFCGIITTESFAASAMGLTVGAMVPTTEAALAVGPSFMTVFIVFGGYYVNAENTPIIFRWIPRVSLIRWAFQGLCINEFSGLQFDHQNSFDIQTGDQALDRLSFGGSTIRDTVVAQSRILLFWYYTTYLMLEKNKPKYQPLEPPPRDQLQTPLKLEPLESETEEPYQPSESPLPDQGKPDQPLQSPPSEPLNLFGLDGL
ncbi:ABC transporter G family member 7-like isoform X2 [Salvia splendens]|uniref:ABC transporter G family member 7-like isoform X2 n=1 Tax=Salvia splendens TaxID=180675 RepID=UPI001C252ACF|nr:ABC transporter G family member 7-like isoform X2 [Salvia splendens]